MADDLSGESVSVVIKNHNGLHVRPASRLVAALSGFNADLVLEKGGKCVSPDSINQIALLQVRCNDTLRLLARGPDAEAALAAFQALAAENFGEQPDAAPAVFAPVAARVQGLRSIAVACEHRTQQREAVESRIGGQQQENPIFFCGKLNLLAIPKHLPPAWKYLKTRERHHRFLVNLEFFYLRVVFEDRQDLLQNFRISFVQLQNHDSSDDITAFSLCL